MPWLVDLKRFRVRRLAVIDIYGRSGSRLRRWLVWAEFTVTPLVCLWIGALFILHLGLAGWVVAAAVIGIGVNYVVLACWAAALRDPARLAREYQAHLPDRDLRYYSVAQLWLLVPFLFVALALRPIEYDV